MASAPFVEARRGQWYMKYKPDPKGPWVRVPLGKHPTPYPPSKPPKKPPQFVLDRSREFAEIEYKAKHGIIAPVRERGLAGYAEAYIEAFKATHSAKSNYDAVRNVRRFVAFAESKGVTTLQAISRSLCRDYLEARHQEGQSPSSLQTEKSWISPLLSRAVIDGLIPANPWSLTALPVKKTEHKPQFWSSEQITQIAESCKKPWQSDLVLVLANTGIRVSAALAMRWDWISWDRGCITIPKEHDKAGKGYSVAMSRVARDILQKRCATAKGDVVFPNPRGKPLHYGTFRLILMYAVAKAGAPTGTPHDLRHSFARLLLASNAPINVVQATLGHASITMTQRYTKVDERAAAPHLDNFGVGDTTSPTPDDPPQLRFGT